MSSLSGSSYDGSFSYASFTGGSRRRGEGVSGAWVESVTAGLASLDRVGAAAFVVPERFLRAVDALQLLSFALPTHVACGGVSWAAALALYATQLPLWDGTPRSPFATSASTFRSLYWAAFAFVMAAVFAVIALGIIAGHGMTRSTFSARLIRLVVEVAATWLYVPLLQTFLSVLVCRGDARLWTYSSEECFRGPQAPVFATAWVGLVGLVALGVVRCGIFVATLPRDSHRWSTPDLTIFAVLQVGWRTALCVAFHLLIGRDHATAFAAFVAIGSAGCAALVSAALPFYHTDSNIGAVRLYLACALIAVVSVVAQAAGPESTLLRAHGDTVLRLIGIAVAALGGYYAALARVNMACYVDGCRAATDRSIAPPETYRFPAGLPVHDLTIRHLRNLCEELAECVADDDVPDPPPPALLASFLRRVHRPEDVEVATRFLQLYHERTPHTATPRMVILASRTYTKGMTRWPGAACVVLDFAAMAAEYARRPLVALRLLDFMATHEGGQRAGGDSHNLYVSPAARARASQLTAAVRLRLNVRDAAVGRLQDRARRLHRDALLHMAVFWTKLLSPQVDMPQLMDAASRIAASRAAAVSAFRRVLTHSDALERDLLLEYAGFAESVLLQPASAQALREAIRQDTEDRRRDAMRGAKSRSRGAAFHYAASGDVATFIDATQDERTDGRVLSWAASVASHVATVAFLVAFLVFAIGASTRERDALQAIERSGGQGALVAHASYLAGVVDDFSQELAPYTAISTRSAARAGLHAATTRLTALQRANTAPEGQHTARSFTLFGAATHRLLRGPDAAVHAGGGGPEGLLLGGYEAIQILQSRGAAGSANDSAVPPQSNASWSVPTLLPRDMGDVEGSSTSTAPETLGFVDAARDETFVFALAARAAARVNGSTMAQVGFTGRLVPAPTPFAMTSVLSCPFERGARGYCVAVGREGVGSTHSMPSNVTMDALPLPLPMYWGIGAADLLTLALTRDRDHFHLLCGIAATTTAACIILLLLATEVVMLSFHIRTARLKASVLGIFLLVPRPYAQRLRADVARRAQELDEFSGGPVRYYSSSEMPAPFDSNAQTMSGPPAGAEPSDVPTGTEVADTDASAEALRALDSGNSRRTAGFATGRQIPGAVTETSFHTTTFYTSNLSGTDGHPDNTGGREDGRRLFSGGTGGLGAGGQVEGAFRRDAKSQRSADSGVGHLPSARGSGGTSGAAGAAGPNASSGERSLLHHLFGPRLREEQRGATLTMSDRGSWPLYAACVIAALVAVILLVVAITATSTAFAELRELDGRVQYIRRRAHTVAALQDFVHYAAAFGDRVPRRLLQLTAAGGFSALDQGPAPFQALIGNDAPVATLMGAFIPAAVASMVANALDPVHSAVLLRWLEGAESNPSGTVGGRGVREGATPSNRRAAHSISSETIRVASELAAAAGQHDVTQWPGRVTAQTARAAAKAASRCAVYALTHAWRLKDYDLHAAAVRYAQIPSPDDDAAMILHVYSNGSTALLPSASVGAGVASNLAMPLVVGELTGAYISDAYDPARLAVLSSTSLTSAAALQTAAAVRLAAALNITGGGSWPLTRLVLPLENVAFNRLRRDAFGAEFARAVSDADQPLRLWFAATVADGIAAAREPRTALVAAGLLAAIAGAMAVWAWARLLQQRYRSGYSGRSSAVALLAALCLLAAGSSLRANARFHTAVNAVEEVQRSRSQVDAANALSQRLTVLARRFVETGDVAAYTEYRDTAYAASVSTSDDGAPDHSGFRPHSLFASVGTMAVTVPAFLLQPTHDATAEYQRVHALDRFKLARRIEAVAISIAATAYARAPGVAPLVGDWDIRNESEWAVTDGPDGLLDYTNATFDRNRTAGERAFIARRTLYAPRYASALTNGTLAVAETARAVQRPQWRQFMSQQAEGVALLMTALAASIAAAGCAAYMIVSAWQSPTDQEQESTLLLLRRFTADAETRDSIVAGATAGLAVEGVIAAGIVDTAAARVAAGAGGHKNGFPEHRGAASPSTARPDSRKAGRGEKRAAAVAGRQSGSTYIPAYGDRAHNRGAPSFLSDVPLAPLRLSTFVLVALLLIAVALHVAAGADSTPGIWTSRHMGLFRAAAGVAAQHVHDLRVDALNARRANMTTLAPAHALAEAGGPVTEASFFSREMLRARLLRAAVSAALLNHRVAALEASLQSVFFRRDGSGYAAYGRDARMSALLLGGSNQRITLDPADDDSVPLIDPAYIEPHIFYFDTGVDAAGNSDIAAVGIAQAAAVAAAQSSIFSLGVPPASSGRNATAATTGAGRLTLVLPRSLTPLLERFITACAQVQRAVRGGGPDGPFQVAEAETLEAVLRSAATAERLYLVVQSALRAAHGQYTEAEDNRRITWGAMIAMVVSVAVIVAVASGVFLLGGRLRQMQSESTGVSVMLRMLPQAARDAIPAISHFLNVALSRGDTDDAARRQVALDAAAITDLSATWPVIIVDIFGIVMKMNAGAEEIFGYSASELIGSNVNMLLFPRVRRAHDGFIAAYRRTGTTPILDAVRHVACRHKDGRAIHTELRLKEVRQSTGEVVFAGFVKDISQRLERAGAQRLNDAVLDLSTMPMILIDAKGTILRFNRAAERCFHHAAVDAIGRNVKMLMPEPVAKHHDGYLAAYLRTRVRHAIDNTRRVTGLKRTGEEFPLEITVRELPGLDGGAANSQFLAFCRDLTVDLALDDANRVNDEIADLAPIPIVGIDAFGAVHKFSRAAVRCFGWEAHEILGRNVKVLMPAEIARYHDRYLQDYRSTGRKHIIGSERELFGRRKDGSVFPLRLYVVEARSRNAASEAANFVGYLVDIEEERRKECEQMVDGALIEASPVPVVVTSTVTGAVVFVNSALLKEFRIDDKAWVLRHHVRRLSGMAGADGDALVRAFAAPDDTLAATAASGLGRGGAGPNITATGGKAISYATIRPPPAPSVAGGPRAPRLTRARVRRGDGTVMDVEVQTEFTHHPDAGGLCVGYIRDVTEALREAFDAVVSRLVITHALTPVLVVDARGVVVQCSEAALDLFRRPSELVVGAPLRTLIVPPSQGGVRRARAAPYFFDAVVTQALAPLTAPDAATGTTAGDTTYVAQSVECAIDATGRRFKVHVSVRAVPLDMREAGAEGAADDAARVFALLLRDASGDDDWEKVAQRNALIAEMCPQPLVQLDAAGIVVAFNKAAETEFGYSFKEVAGHSVRMLMTETSGRVQMRLLDACVRRWQRASVNTSAAPAPGGDASGLQWHHPMGPARSGGTATTHRMHGLRRDGTTFPMEVTLAEVCPDAAHTALNGFVWSARNIAEESRLEKAHGTGAAVLDLSPSPLIAIDAKGVVLRFNRAAEAAFGYAARSVIGHKVNMLMNDKDAAAHDGYLTAYLKTGEKRLMDSARVRIVTGKRANGQLFPLELRVKEIVFDRNAAHLRSAPVFLSPEALAADPTVPASPLRAGPPGPSGIDAASSAAGGAPASPASSRWRDGAGGDAQAGLQKLFIAYMQDCTEAFELERSTKVFNTTVQLSPVPLITIDTHGIVRDVNPAVTEEFGWTHDDIVGRNIKMMMPERYASRHDYFLQRYAALRQKRLLDTARVLAARTRAGEEVPVEVRVREVIDTATGEPSYVGYVRNLQNAMTLQRGRALSVALATWSPTALLTVSAAGVIDAASPALGAIVQYGESELIGRDMVAALGLHGVMALPLSAMGECAAGACARQAVAALTHGKAEPAVTTPSLLRDGTAVAAMLRVKSGATCPVCIAIHRVAAGVEASTIWLVVVTDLTRYFEPRLAALLATNAATSHPVAAIVTDADGTIIELNAAAQRLLRVAPAAAVGCGAADFIDIAGFTTWADFARANGGARPNSAGSSRAGAAVRVRLIPQASRGVPDEGGAIRALDRVESEDIAVATIACWASPSDAAANAPTTTDDTTPHGHVIFLDPVRSQRSFGRATRDNEAVAALAADPILVIHVVPQNGNAVARARLVGATAAAHAFFGAHARSTLSHDATGPAAIAAMLLAAGDRGVAPTWLASASGPWRGGADGGVREVLAPLLSPPAIAAIAAASGAAPAPVVRAHAFTSDGSAVVARPVEVAVRVLYVADAELRVVRIREAAAADARRWHVALHTAVLRVAGDTTSLVDGTGMARRISPAFARIAGASTTKLSRVSADGGADMSTVDRGGGTLPAPQPFDALFSVTHAAAVADLVALTAARSANAWRLANAAVGDASSSSLATVAARAIRDARIDRALFRALAPVILRGAAVDARVAVRGGGGAMHVRTVGLLESPAVTAAAHAPTASGPSTAAPLATAETLTSLAATITHPSTPAPAAGWRDLTADGLQLWTAVDLSREAALARAQAVLVAAFDRAPAALVMAHASDGTILRINRAARRLFDFDPAHVMGRSLRILVPEASAAVSDGAAALAYFSSAAGVISAERRNGDAFHARVVVTRVSFHAFELGRPQMAAVALLCFRPTMAALAAVSAPPVVLAD